MNFIEAITLYQDGKSVKRRGDTCGLFPSLSMIKKQRNDRDREKLRENHIGITEADVLANDWVVYGDTKK
jgi:hypothetical protein